MEESLRDIHSSDDLVPNNVLEHCSAESHDPLGVLSVALEPDSDDVPDDYRLVLLPVCHLVLVQVSQLVLTMVLNPVSQQVCCQVL